MISWQSEHFRDHELIGRIWDVSQREWIDELALIQELAEAPFVLLGEAHDNPDHHLLQHRVLEALITGGRRPALAFEMIDADRQGALDHVVEMGGCAEAIGASVNWNESWGSWQMYRPLVKTARDASLAIVAANLPRSQARRLVREGLDSLDGETITQLGLDHELDPELQQALQQEMVDVHCGHLPLAMTGGMVLAQRARDGRMAERLASSATADGSVLIAGAGHVRSDRGVPPLLERMRPDERVLSLAFVEAAAGLTAPSEYARRYGVDELPFDFVWFTPTFSVEDPCEAFRSHRK